MTYRASHRNPLSRGQGATPPGLAEESPTWGQPLLPLLVLSPRTTWPGDQMCLGSAGPTAAGSYCSSPDKQGHAAWGDMGDSEAFHKDWPVGTALVHAEKKYQSFLAYSFSPLVHHKS